MAIGRPSRRASSACVRQFSGRRTVGVANPDIHGIGAPCHENQLPAIGRRLGRAIASRPTTTGWTESKLGPLVRSKRRIAGLSTVDCALKNLGSFPERSSRKRESSSQAPEGMFGLLPEFGVSECRLPEADDDAGMAAGSTFRCNSEFPEVLRAELSSVSFRARCAAWYANGPAACLRRDSAFPEIPAKANATKRR